MSRNFRERIPHWMVIPPLLLASALIVVAALYFIAAGIAHAAPAVANDVKDVPPTSKVLLFSSIQFWTFAIGSLTPLVAYVFNTHAPWVSEPVKAGVQVAVAALAAALLQLLDAGELALNAQTLQLCGSAVAAALFSHKFLWLPSGIGQILGAGQNKNLSSA